MRLLIVSDAWAPQVNGVVTSLRALQTELQALGHEVAVLSPQDFRTLPCPTYPEIRLSLAGPRAIARHIEHVRPDFIHIATEGPIGYMTRRYCRKRRWPFTTTCSTRLAAAAAAAAAAASAAARRARSWAWRSR